MAARAIEEPIQERSRFDITRNQAVIVRVNRKNAQLILDAIAALDRDGVARQASEIMVAVRGLQPEVDRARQSVKAAQELSASVQPVLEKLEAMRAEIERLNERVAAKGCCTIM